jgi:hypothetical protein
MRPWQVRVLLVLLVSNFLFCDGALNYLSMPAGNSQSGRQVFLVWMGILVAQPALLAIWAVFGSESLFVRLPRAVFLVSLVSLAVTPGTWLNLAGRLDEDSLGLILSPFCQFTLLLCQINYRQNLIRKAHIHYRRRMTFGGREVHQAALSQKTDASAVRQDILLHVLAGQMDLRCHSFKSGDVDFHVEVTRIGEDHTILHSLEMRLVQHFDVARRGTTGIS